MFKIGAKEDITTKWTLRTNFKIIQWPWSFKHTFWCIKDSYLYLVGTNLFYYINSSSMNEVTKLYTVEDHRVKNYSTFRVLGAWISFIIKMANY